MSGFRIKDWTRRDLIGQSIEQAKAYCPPRYYELHAALLDRCLSDNSYSCLLTEREVAFLGSLTGKSARNALITLDQIGLIRVNPWLHFLEVWFAVEHIGQGRYQLFRWGDREPDHG